MVRFNASSHFGKFGMLLAAFQSQESSAMEAIMTMSTLTNGEDEHVINTELPKSSMDLHFAHSWNCTEVFLDEEVVNGVMENLEDMRCDSDVFCPTQDRFRRQDNAVALEILNDLKNSEGRQDPPLEKNLHEMYSLDSANSILEDSYDELDELKLIVYNSEAFEGEREASKSSKSDGSYEIEALRGAEDTDDPFEDESSPFLQSLAAISEEATADLSELSDNEAIPDASKYDKMECQSPSTAVPDQFEKDLEDILQVNGEIRYEDVVSYIDDSFLPPSEYFDDNAMEQQRGKEKFRCAFLPFLC